MKTITTILFLALSLNLFSQSVDSYIDPSK